MSNDHDTIAGAFDATKDRITEPSGSSAENKVRELRADSLNDSDYYDRNSLGASFRCPVVRMSS